MRANDIKIGMRVITTRLYTTYLLTVDSKIDRKYLETRKMWATGIVHSCVPGHLGVWLIKHNDNDMGIYYSCEFRPNNMVRVIKDDTRETIIKSFNDLKEDFNDDLCYMGWQIKRKIDKMLKELD